MFPGLSAYNSSSISPIILSNTTPNKQTGYVTHLNQREATHTSTPFGNHNTNGIIWLFEKKTRLYEEMCGEPVSIF